MIAPTVAAVPAAWTVTAWLCPTCGEMHGAGDQLPAFATKRDRSWRTMGGQVAIVAVALGTPLMPWQQLVADVATEYRVDKRGRIRWHYPVVVLTVPRQCGKSTLLHAIKVHRAMIRRRARIFGTAQRGKDARDLWKELVERVQSGPLAGSATVLRGTGSETLRFPNASEIRPFAPTRDSLHGKTPHFVDVDEAWAFDAAKGEDLMAAIKPAQITLPDRQLWIVSTAGDADSAFLRGWVDTGRLAVAQLDAEVAYFEWSAAEGEDAYDPHTWRFHPAIGYTIEYLDIAAEAAGSRGMFERAYMNRWTTTAETIVDMDLFDTLAGEQHSPDVSRLAIAYEVANDRSQCSIFASWIDDAGVVQVRPYMIAPGTTWLVPELLRIVVELRPRIVAADDGGPARQYSDELRRALELDGQLVGPTLVETLGYRDFATACGSALSWIKDRRLGHDGGPELRAALESAVLKFVSDQVAFDRRRSSGPIDALIAATVAAWFATHSPAELPAPMIRFAGDERDYE